MTQLYTAKCFWPGVTEDAVRTAAARVDAGTAAFRGAYLLPGDALVLSLFEAESPVSVKRTAEAAGMPCERVIESLWVAARVGPKRSRNEGGER